MAEATFDEIFVLCRKTWAKEPEDRPTFEQLEYVLRDMHQRDCKIHEPARDIGLICFQALESRRKSKRKPGERGGSMIRAVKEDKDVPAAGPVGGASNLNRESSFRGKRTSLGGL